MGAAHEERSLDSLKGARFGMTRKKESGGKDVWLCLRLKKRLFPHCGRDSEACPSEDLFIAIAGLRFGMAVGDAGSELLHDEFLKYVGGSGLTNGNQGVLDGVGGAALRRGIIQIRVFHRLRSFRRCLNSSACHFLLSPLVITALASA